MRVVIMAGGKGTRITQIASAIPKPMIPMAGKPVLEHQLNVLRRQGVKRATIVVGYLGDKITEYFQNGKDWDIEIDYIVEEVPLGSAGALSNMRECAEDILLLNGDIVFDVDLSAFYQYHKEKHAGITLFTHPNNHPYDSTLIEVDRDGKVLRSIKKEERQGDYKNRVNAGLHMISADVLKTWPEQIMKLDLDRDIVQKEIAKGNVYAYDSTEYVKDMGTPERYHQVELDMKEAIPAKKNRKKKQKAIFLDRDGTINVYKHFLNQREQMELLPEAAEAIRMINQSGYLAIIITNQPVIARGECTWEELDAIHKRMERMLGEQGAYIDAVYVCPHHPDKGFKGEIEELKIDCECRKPKSGLLLQAAQDYNIDLLKSYMIGDSDRDVQAGKGAGCQTILVKDGLTKKVVEEILVKETGRIG